MYSSFRLRGPCSTAARSFLPVCVLRVGTNAFQILFKCVANLASLLYRINIFELFSITTRGSASNFIIYNLLARLDSFLQIPPFELLEKRRSHSQSIILRFLSAHDHLLRKKDKISNLMITNYIAKYHHIKIRESKYFWKIQNQISLKKKWYHEIALSNSTQWFFKKIYEIII